MKFYKFKIAGGNTTLLVEGCNLAKRNEITRKGLQVVEQVGYINSNNCIPKLEMMGDELCINGTLAFAALLGGKGQLQTSGIDKNLRFSNIGDESSITFPLSVSQPREDIVLLPGIGFQLKEGSSIPSLNELKYLAQEFSRPAFGVAFYSENQLLAPFIYVGGTNTLVKETACGSGSVAINVVTGQRNIYQPTGQKISILRSGDKFTVSAKVVKMGASKLRRF